MAPRLDHFGYGTDDGGDRFEGPDGCVRTAMMIRLHAR
jgi:hypothetical protein